MYRHPPALCDATPNETQTDWLSCNTQYGMLVEAFCVGVSMGCYSWDTCSLPVCQEDGLGKNFSVFL